MPWPSCRAIGWCDADERHLLSEYSWRRHSTAAISSLPSSVCGSGWSAASCCRAGRRWRERRLRLGAPAARVITRSLRGAARAIIAADRRDGPRKEREECEV
eukprot:scaffold302154_cov28-Tisochrysis_lutea.AAC.3